MSAFGTKFDLNDQLRETINSVSYMTGEVSRNVEQFLALTSEVSNHCQCCQRYWAVV
jgi:hypothetical protein